MSNLNDLLRDARDLIGEHGWVQYKNGSLGDGFCTIGALLMARSNRGWADSRDGGLTEAAKLLSRIVDRPIMVWNDTDGRTEKEVLEVFDSAIDETSEAVVNEWVDTAESHMT